MAHASHHVPALLHLWRSEHVVQMPHPLRSDSLGIRSTQALEALPHEVICRAIRIPGERERRQQAAEPVLLLQHLL